MATDAKVFLTTPLTKQNLTAAKSIVKKFIPTIAGISKSF